MRPKDKVVKTDQTSKHENFKKAQERNMQETRDTMKRPNHQNIKIDEGKEPQLNCIDQIFNKIIEQNFSKLMKDTLI